MRQYKSGIYQIKNLTTGHIYIGSSSNIYRRWNDHRYILSKNRHHAAHLQNSYNKHGLDKFNFSILLFCENKDLLFFEQRCLDLYKPEYNSMLVAKPNFSLGFKHSEEAKLKMSKAKLGNKHSEETKIKMSLSSKGGTRPPVSLETRQKMSLAQLNNSNAKKLTIK